MAWAGCSTRCRAMRKAANHRYQVSTSRVRGWGLPSQVSPSAGHGGERGSPLPTRVVQWGCSLEPESFSCDIKRAQWELLVSEVPKFFAEGIAGVGAYPAIEAA